MSADERHKAIRALRMRLLVFGLVRYARSATAEEIAGADADCRDIRAKLAAMGYFVDIAPVCLGD